MNCTVWRQPLTGEYLIGSQVIEGLSPLQRRILSYLIENPCAYLTKTKIIEAAWPSEVARAGVSDGALQRQISSLRHLLGKYCPTPLIETWRGIPEGGYRLLANGRFNPLPLPHSTSVQDLRR